MRRARGLPVVAAAALLVAGCHAGVEPVAVLVPPPVTPAPVPPTPPPAPVAPTEGSVGLEACKGARLDVDFQKLRAAPRAEWIRRLFLHDARFADLAVAGVVEPFGDARVARFCAAVLRGGDWDAIVLTHRLEPPTVEAALRVYSARVDEGGSEALGVPGVQGTRVRTGDTAWSAQRARAGELLLVPAEAGPRSASLYRGSAPLDPAGLEDPASAPAAGALVARLTLDAPAQRMPWAPDLSELRSLRAELRATPAGTAELRAKGEAVDAAAALALAARLTARAEEVGRPLAVRMVLRGLLSSLKVRTNGAEVEVRLPASAPQVDALLALVAAAVGARLDGPPDP
ncbi:MAG: hypothetical protein IPF92_01250 [Myxococcales bacterium]|nr:hypothetical protein [Myxococcales bacterium]MBL0193759.1 hypothetical protein [Myxococcales bacterium]HQY62129.1 hypothetical protein [Polyangiaceae bacterium]